jgi:hypothetical protein
MLHDDCVVVETVTVTVLEALRWRRLGGVQLTSSTVRLRPLSPHQKLA